MKPSSAKPRGSRYSTYKWKKKFFPLATVPGSMGKTSGLGRSLEDVEQLPRLVESLQREGQFDLGLLAGSPRFGGASEINSVL
jgi:hypothetical protein